MVLRLELDRADASEVGADLLDLAHERRALGRVRREARALVGALVALVPEARGSRACRRRWRSARSWCRRRSSSPCTRGRGTRARERRTEGRAAGRSRVRRSTSRRGCGVSSGISHDQCSAFGQNVVGIAPSVGAGRAGPVVDGDHRLTGRSGAVTRSRRSMQSIAPHGQAHGGQGRARHRLDARDRARDRRRGARPRARPSWSPDAPRPTGHAVQEEIRSAGGEAIVRAGRPRARRRRRARGRRPRCSGTAR